MGIKGLKSPKENDPRPIRSTEGGGKALAVGKGANTHRTSATSYIWGAEKVHIVVATKAAAVTGKKAVEESFCVRGIGLKSCPRRNPPPPVDERHSQPTIARAP